MESSLKMSEYGKTWAIRRLTPVECCRLQGFPDDWNDNMSDTQRYKQMGNAVTTNVIAAVGSQILNKANLEGEDE